MSKQIADHQENWGQIFDNLIFWPKFADGENVFDLGCGGGVLTRRLGREFPGTHFVGVDRHGPLIEVAKERAYEENLQNVTFQSGDVTQLRFQGASGIFCRFLLEDLKEPQSLIASMYEDLRSEGWACAVERLNEYSKVYPRSIPIEKSWQAVFDYFHNTMERNPHVTRQMPSFFREAGFKEVVVKGYSTVVSRSSHGQVFDWYIDVAIKMLSDVANAADSGPWVESVVFEQAIKDYRRMLEVEDAFVLEAALSVSGIKPNG